MSAAPQSMVAPPGPTSWASPPPAGGATGTRPKRPYPPREWPSMAQLSYTKELITVLLLVLALPWLVKKIATRPGDVFAAAGHKQIGKP